ncbi:MAG: pilin [Gammaproteobacteria bacterium]
MKTLQKGFTLIELMIVVAIIGILAAIAIPAYQDYTIRSQVSEGLTLASDIKAGIAEYLAQTGSWPTNLIDVGLGSAITAKESRYVESINVTTGTIQILYGRDANSKINNLTSTTSGLDLQPFVNANGDVIWLCGNANPPQNGLADPGDGTPSTAVATSLLDKYMPASCRTNFGGN